MDSDKQDGIQKLLRAEQEANAIVTAARQEKTARIKQAKDEAEAEIQLYRNQREQRYQQMVAQATGGSDEMTKELEMKAKHAEANMRATIQKKEASVTGMLVKHVTSVHL
mmetsp:Transcript_6892/g.20629  ORF Transcript_6892/g.20629 Transcript_6892/m.20629 type:complete len:110 (+) Transcript_6892:253-582(+)